MSKVKQWTKNQAAAICAKEDKILVSAGAGSGKTSVMIERVVSLIESGVSLENMAICTFTKVAAADMKHKLLLRLEEKEDNPFFAAQLKILPQADISTLHSWCSRIIRTYFYASEIDPNFEIMPEGLARQEKSAAIERVIEEEIAAGNEDFVTLYEVLMSGRKHKPLAKMIARLYEFAAVMPASLDWLNSLPNNKPQEYYIAELETFYEGERKSLEYAASRLLEDIYAAKFESEIESAENLVAVICGIDGELLPSPRVGKSHEMRNLHERLLALRDRYKKWRSGREEALALKDGEQTNKYVLVLARMAAAVFKYYGEAKKRRSQLDYNDLEHEALKILNSEYAGEVKAKYRYVFIDEYQDINPLQSEILRLDGVNMFFVGDIKQSIYGFRLCAPEYFVKKYEDYSGGEEGRAIELNANFRSDDKILQFVNSAFDKIMTRGFGKVDYAAGGRFEKGRELYTDSVTAQFVREDLKDAEKKSEIYSVCRHDFSQESDGADCETNLVLAHILQLLKSTIVEDGKERQVNFGDIAVLVRSRDGFAGKLIKKLKRADIPCKFFDQDNYSSHPAIAALISYLKIIDNREDDINLAACMLNIADFTEDDLTEIRIFAAAEETFYDSVIKLAQSVNGADRTLQEEENKRQGAEIFAIEDCAIEEEYTANIEYMQKLAARVARFISTLDYFAELADILIPAELAGKITAHFSLFKKATFKYGESESEALGAFLTEMEKTENSDLYEFIKGLEGDESTLDTAEPENYLKLMTIHAAKGLEFPFVILPNLSKKFNFTDLNESMILADSVALKYFDEENRAIVPTAQMQVEKMRLRRKLLEEEMRILYVALTRPKLQLALFGTIKSENNSAESENSYGNRENNSANNENSYGNRENNSADSENNSNNSENLVASGKKNAELATCYLDWLREPCAPFCKVFSAEECAFEFSAPPKRVVFSRQDENLTKKIAERINWVDTSLHVAEKTNVSKMLADTKLAAIKEDISERKAIYLFDDEKADGYLKAGTAYHKLMEALDFEKDFSKDFTIEWQELENNHKALTQICEKSKVARAAVLVQQLAGKQKIYKEQPFIMRGETLIQGVIDAMILDWSKREAIIIDYKTTKAERIKSEEYSRQLQLYARAAEGILGVKVVKKLIYSFELGEFLEV